MEKRFVNTEGQRYLNTLVANYNKVRKRTVFDQKTEYDFDDIVEYCKRFSEWCIRNGLIASRSFIKSSDTIDYSLVLDQTKQMKSDMPAIHIPDEDYAKLDENWYLTIPPLKKGVLRININRYLYFELVEINEDRNGYEVFLTDYMLDHGVWTVDSIITGFCSWVSGEEKKKIHAAVKGRTMSGIMKGVLDDNVKDFDREWSENDRLFLSKVVIPFLRRNEPEDNLHDTFNHFCMAIIQTNLQLEKGKPKAQRGSGRKFKDVPGEIENNPKPQIIRTLSGGITIKSVKMPQLPSPATIRKYKLASWNSRSHTRTLKSGKVVFVNSSVKHRKCLKGAENIAPSQTIIKVQSIS